MVLSYINFADGNSFITPRAVVTAVIVGLFCGCVMSLYSKMYLGRVVRRLCEKEAFGKDCAADFSSLGIKPSFSIKRALRDNSSLRKHISVANPAESALIDDSGELKKKIRKFFTGKRERDTLYDLSLVKLYIPTDKKYAAQVKYESRGNPVFLIAAAVILFFAAAVIMYFGLPKILEMLDSVITSVKNL